MPVANLIEYKGKMYTLRQLSEETGLSKATLNSRLEAGWGIEKAVETPLRITTLRKYPYHGKMLTAAELAALHGNISVRAMRERLNNGMTPEQAVMEPKTPGGRFIPRKEVEAVPVSGGGDLYRTTHRKISGSARSAGTVRRTAAAKCCARSSSCTTRPNGEDASRGRIAPGTRRITKRQTERNLIDGWGR